MFDESAIGEVVRKILRTRLRCHGEAVSSAEAALERLAPDVNDSLNGREDCRRIEGDPPEAIGRLLFITAGARTSAAPGFSSKTGRPLLLDPFGLPELTAAIRNRLTDRSVAGESAEHPAGGTV